MTGAVLCLTEQIRFRLQGSPDLAGVHLASLYPAERTLGGMEGVRGPTRACREGREALDLPTLLRLQWSYMATRGRTRQQTATQAPVLAPGRNLPFLPASVSSTPGLHVNPLKCN